ncbi:MAG: helicase-related protein [Candidatus Hodarchaeales archaeon]|jgi:superfamily II DNA or RNA helicase
MYGTAFSAFSSELCKIADTVKTTPAALKSVLLPHQERIIRRIKKSPGLVVAHGLGSGKTYSSIAASVKLNPDNVTVLVPAALKDNYKKELDKHVEGTLPVQIGSLQKAVKDGEMAASDLLIVDEAHRARESKSKTYGTLSKAKAKKRLMLTASPVYNKPKDIASLVNLAAGKKILPLGSDFDKKYVKQPRTGLLALLPWSDPDPQIIRKKELGGVLNAWVDRHESTGSDFPDRTDERVSVPMSKRQAKIHQMAWGGLPLMTRMRMKKGLPPHKKELQELNKFESQARQVSNTEAPFTVGGDAPITPKLRTAYGKFKEKADSNPRHKAVVYSNYLGSLTDYSKMLEQDGVPHASFTGKQKGKERKQIIEDFNNDKIKALLVSSAGGEGLDLKGTRQVQVLEPHWNEEKVKQVIGRAIRHKSHANLPAKERKVHVEKYDTYPKGLLGGKKLSVEDWLYDMSDQKERLNNQLLDLIQSEDK